MKKIFPAFILLLISLQPATAQSFSNDRTTDEFFAYRVNLIDEFIFRFNDDAGSALRTEYARQHKNPSAITRSRLLSTLFNWQNPRMLADTPLIRSFMTEVLNPDHPRLLSFTDTDLYVAARFIFSLDRQEIVIPMTLHMTTNKAGGSKWMIAGLGAHKQLQSEAAGDDVSGKFKGKFIPPISHNTDFRDFERLFTKNMNGADFFEPALLEQQKTKQLIHYLKSGRLTFRYASDLKFYFFQIPDWVFMVEEFKRQATNSGWLINRLQKMPREDKDQLKKALLLEES